MDTFLRFMAKVSIDPKTKCWNWTASKIRGGYGGFFNGERVVMAHRFAYERFRGPIPGTIADRKWVQLDHLCHNPGCVNPAHLEIVTSKENHGRGNTGKVSKERAAAVTHCPEGHPYSGSNLYLRPIRPGRYASRICRACDRAAGARYRERQRALKVGDQC